MAGPRCVVRYDRWEHQWLRILRWHGRTLKATGRLTGRASRDAEDFSEALCHSVWHLKDWLKNDPHQTWLAPGDIETFANNDPALMVVADLANGTKHVQLSAKGAAGSMRRQSPPPSRPRCSSWARSRLHSPYRMLAGEPYP